MIEFEIAIARLDQDFPRGFSLAFACYRLYNGREEDSRMFVCGFGDVFNDCSMTIGDVEIFYIDSGLTGIKEDLL